LVFLVLGGCANIIRSQTSRLAGNLNSAIADQNDPATVRQGAPAYLLFVDGLIHDDPENVELLLMGARLYGTYATAFVDDASRARLLTARANEYAERALCGQSPNMCPALSLPYEDFVRATTSLSSTDVPALYGWASALAGRIQAHDDDWTAIAELPKVEAAMRRVIELDEHFDGGGAHLYLGVLYTLRPPALGGKPEAARRHFERALELSEQRNLMAKVLFAKHYARLVFDRGLHDQLLREVLAAQTGDPGRTLSNTLAQSEARRLLATSDEYF
jgi:tetratricopeptide (TPR) repeat protein